MPLGANIVVALAVFFAVLIVLAGARTVPQGCNWTVERFGRYVRTLKPGLRVIVPGFDRVGRKINMMEQLIEVPQQEVITADNVRVTADAIALFQVVDAFQASYEVANLDQAIVRVLMTSIRSVMADIDLDRALSQRSAVNERLRCAVDAAASAWGVKINRVELKDVTPPVEIVEAMRRHARAEREGRAEMLAADGQRRSDILRAEGRKQADILAAEGRKAAALLDAEARECLAQAEVKAAEMLSEAVRRGGAEAVNYLIASSCIKAVAELASSPNQKLLVLPIEGSNGLSAAAVAKVVRAVLADRGAAPSLAQEASGSSAAPPI